ncbi:MAG: serine protease [Treponema sp.]|nr:serine protease [Treponema sp.]
MKKIIFPIISFFILCAAVFSQDADSSGTGFFINANGVIVTCAHVIEDMDRVVVLINNQEYSAEILRMDLEKDIAILSISYRNPFHFRLANFNTANLGDRLSVLGYPLSFILGSDIRYTEGSVSARNGINSDPVFFQHSAPTQPGNSGGPIINGRFEVIGINAAVINDDMIKRNAGTIPQNINFGIKSEYIPPILGNIRAGNGNVRNINDAANATVLILGYASQINQTIITAVNRTGYTGFYLYISPTSSDAWGPDRLGESILSNRQSITLQNIPASSNNRYDVRLIDSDGDSYTKWNVLIMPNERVEFTFDDLDRQNAESAPPVYNGPPITIVNNTGYTVYYLYISPTSDDVWGLDRLAANQTLGNRQSVTVNLPHPLNVTNRYDIMLQDSDGDTYSKFNVAVTANGRVVFTSRDID